MSEVKRYEITEFNHYGDSGAYMEENSQGDYVTLEDYDTLAKKLAECEKTIAALEGDGSWGEMAMTVKLDALQSRLDLATGLLQRAKDGLVPNLQYHWHVHAAAFLSQAAGEGE